MTEQKAEKERGLEPRYRVEKISDPTGKHDECRYFVLDPQHDPLAREALLAYEREARRNGYFDLADDLGLWVHEINEAEYAASRIPSEPRVHNHPPYRPVCNERCLPDGQLRGACLNDDGSDR